jgi:L-ascorbate metabolism protein UlaG (beta-lactamase superfamily)
MILRYYGHSLFTMALECGVTLLTDPYGDFFDYPKRQLKADIVTISHHHHDHDALSMVAGRAVVLDQPGQFTPAPGLGVTGVPGWHDAHNGEQRGGNLMFVIETEGLRIIHMGDIGHRLTDRQCLQLGTPDLLLIPVGGNYTIDAQTAAETVNRLHPRVTIPMHYQTEYDRQMPIQTEAPFLQLMGMQPVPVSVARFTAGDLCEREPVMRMSVTAPTIS